ncbi:hypothetical protein BDW02DRAFT_279877 [Decorospora gaudefroyi]|uniref:Uncharacterized protein n=1 Tax=Decorospora gaudefroyi TaxID=184978 RepID=A0A6A5KIB3_9PLEO|nr:hypothetical protein BDW02DRAFT_279877 [Decorospora gaudefroyi]
MSSHHHHHHPIPQPPPPIRTNTVSSQKSHSSTDPTSPLYSPSTSPTSNHTSSPTESSFFGAISARIRDRSRSRSRKRSKSPTMDMSPEHQAQQAARPPLQQTNHRHSLQDVGRRSTSGSECDPWRGRHSNDWLFNGYSVTASAKELIHRRK